MQVREIRERSVPLSRYADRSIASAALSTSVVAVLTDMNAGDGPLTGYGFASVGRFGQGGLIRERFAPRLLQADPKTLLSGDGVSMDPDKVWAVMMAAEKPGGHSDRRDEPVCAGCGPEGCTSVRAL